MYRVGRKQKRVILDKNSLEVAHFKPGFESLAQEVCDLLNKKSKDVKNKSDNYE